MVKVLGAPCGLSRALQLVSMTIAKGQLVAYLKILADVVGNPGIFFYINININRLGDAVDVLTVPLRLKAKLALLVRESIMPLLRIKH